MALQKQPINLTFNQGIDTKTDPDQVPIGKLLSLENAVFNTGGLLQKRNGFGLLSTLPISEQSNLLTLNDNLLATGSNLYAYNSNTDTWLNRGTVRPVDLNVKSIVRNSNAQIVIDGQVDAYGNTCVAFAESSIWYYQISNSETGQVIKARTALPSNSTDARVFLLGRYFIVTYLISGPARLAYVAIPSTDPQSSHAPVTISSVVSGTSAGYDGVVANNSLFIAFDANDGGGAVRILFMNSALSISTAKVTAGAIATLMSLTADTTGNAPIIYMTYYDSGSMDGFTKAYNTSLVEVLAQTQVINNIDVHSITSSAQSMVNTIFYETANQYSFGSIDSDFVSSVTCTQMGVVGSPAVVLRSVGLGSKSFIQNGQIYLLVSYGQTFQPTYFLIDASGNILTKLAYSNGAGYAASQVLSSVSQNNDVVYIHYLYKAQLVPVNKTQGVAAVAGIYALTGVNLAQFTLTTPHQYSSEIASCLNLTGGIFWMYDAVKPVEQGFHVWPEDVHVSTSTTGGSITDQQYYYVATYEWTDAQGNLHRSAPSNPIGQVTAGGNTSTNTIDVPTLRLTYKTTPNDVRIVIYRWSTAQQTYYQITSITSPLLNNPAVDSVQYVDTHADSAILGNIILYTTGGIVENIGAPAAKHACLFKSRQFLIDAEDTNLLWYSKQVIEATPTEMSDLFTQYIPPTTGAQGSTGGMECISAMDDKLIIFKKDAIYYMVGNGPDNTGANNDFSEAVFITGAVGCANPNSIVMTPMGLMFQSDKGIWLLGRNLQTQYIGAEVEAFNSSLVKSALVIPGTNQVRFTLERGAVLMYDYYYGQWGTFTNIPAISACLYQGMHTYLNEDAQVRKEMPGTYLDNTSPVLMKFTTAWFQLQVLQGFQRAYFMYVIGNYKTPHTLNVQVSYDYDSSPQQSTLILPTNYSPKWGGLAQWGSGEAWGGPSNLEQWRVFFRKQKCQAIQVSISEQYDATLGVPAGAGLTFSGINMIIGAKAGYPKLSAAKSAG